MAPASRGAAVSRPAWVDAEFLISTPTVDHEAWRHSPRTAGLWVALGDLVGEYRPGPRLGRSKMASCYPDPALQFLAAGFSPGRMQRDLHYGLA